MLVLYDRQRRIEGVAYADDSAVATSGEAMDGLRKGRVVQLLAIIEPGNCPGGYWLKGEKACDGGKRGIDDIPDSMDILVQEGQASCCT
jgi:hypothetical protein